MSIDSLHIAIDEGAGLAARGFRPRLLDQAVVRRQMAHGLGDGGIAGEVKRLTAAATEGDRAPVAAPAGLEHPALAAECLKTRGVAPDVAERTLRHRVEREAGQRVRGMTRKHEPVRTHHDEPSS